MTQIHVVAGGQFGSEGKGAFTVELMRRMQTVWDERDPVLVRVAGPNAGHTAYDPNGRKWSLRQIPVGAVENHDSMLVIGQQSEIDPSVLFEEINKLEAAGIPTWDRLRVDYHATVIDEEHREAERSITTGTTGKGIGGARAARILRKARLAKDLGEQLGAPMADTVEYLRQQLGRGRSVIVEGTQGYGLGTHAGYYPYCTSSNCRPGDFLTMTGLQPLEADYRPWLVYRVHPIRIAGDSGPMFDETSWDELDVEPELTTVTQKVRRVGQWDSVLAGASYKAASLGARAVLRFVDYEVPADDIDSVRRYMHLHEQRFHGYAHVPLMYAGLGPDTGMWRPAEGWKP